MKRMKKTLGILLSLVLLISVVAATALAAYSAQGDNGQTLTMLTPSDITEQSADDYYLNTINTPFDSASDVIFTFTMSAGMNNFSEETFIETNLPQISVCDTYGGTVVTAPTYVSGSSANITISAGMLDEGDYVIVFGQDIQGNNASKTLGKDVVFEFTVSADVVTEPPASPYDDVPVDDADYVTAVIANGCMQSESETMFGSATLISRGEFVMILGMARGIKADKYPTSAFDDIADSDAYSPYVAWAAGKNIVNGYGDGNFGPGDTLTREQAVTILHRYAVAFSMDTSASGDVSAFSDQDAVSSWAAAPMAWAVGMGYIGDVGGGMLMPQAEMTKMDVARMIAVMLLGQ